MYLTPTDFNANGFTQFNSFPSDEQLLSLQMEFLLNTFLALKHYKEETYIRQQFGLLFKLEGEDVHGNFTRALLVYLIRITEIQPLELNNLLEQVEAHQKKTIMSTYDMIIAEAIEERSRKEKKEKALEHILLIRTSLQKNIDIEIVALLLKISPNYVKKTQAALQKKSEILQFLKDKHTIKQIAKQLKISELVVEAIKNLKIKNK